MLNIARIVSCILTTWDLNKNLLPHRFSRWISCQIHYSNQQCYQFGLMKWYRLFHLRNCQCRYHTPAPCQCSKTWYLRLSNSIDTCNRHQSSLVRSPKKLLEMMKTHANINHKSNRFDIISIIKMYTIPRLCSFLHSRTSTWSSRCRSYLELSWSLRRSQSCPWCISQENVHPSMLLPESN